VLGLTGSLTAGVVTTTSVSPTSTKITKGSTSGAHGLSASFGVAVATIFGLLLGASML